MRLIDEDYVSVGEAAELLKVASSTIWRWINQGDLAAYRVGRRRVLIKQQDLDRLITPARTQTQNGAKMLDVERQRLARPLAPEEQKMALAAIDAAEIFSTELRKRHGGRLFADSAEVLREMREERTAALS